MRYLAARIRSAQVIANPASTDTVAFGSTVIRSNSNAHFSDSLGGIGMDSGGNLYVTDNQAIRKATHLGTNWVVTTIGGTANSSGGYADDTGSSALFRDPQGVTVDSAGTLYVADTHNHAIRQGATTLPLLQIARAGNQVILTWPALAVGFVLERSGAVPAHGNWAAVANGAVISGANNVVTNNLDAGAAFYRLHKP